jgi:hypothetical protein
LKIFLDFRSMPKIIAKRNVHIGDIERGISLYDFFRRGAGLENCHNRMETLASGGDSRFGDERLQDGRFDVQHFSTKGFDMKLDCGFHIDERFFVGIALTYYYALDAKRIGYIAISMFLDNDLELLQHSSLLSR